MKFLIARRVLQTSLLFFYFMGNYGGWKVLQGNLSSSLVFGVIPLSDPYAILQIFATGTLVAFDALIGGTIILLLYGLFVGRAFCSWVCPINLVSDFANYLRKISDAKDVERKTWLSRNIRYWALGLSLVVSAIMAVPAFEFISPISMIHRGIVFGIGFGWAAVMSVFLFDLFVAKNGFCGHICPLGGFYSLISRFSLLRIKHHQEKCTLCMKCKDVCPEKQVLGLIGKRDGFVNSGECVNCGRCIEVCEDSALGFGIRTNIKIKEENYAET